MGRTRPSTLGLLAVAVLVVGWSVLSVLEDRATYLPPVPWVVGPVLLVLGLGVLWAARAVRAYIRGQRPGLDALRAARTVALAKAASLTGALLVGWYGAQVLLALGNADVASQRARALAAAVATVCAVGLTVLALVAERYCELPPDDRAEGGIREDGAHD